MPRKSQNPYQAPAIDDFEMMLMEDAVHGQAADFMMGINQFVLSAIELTKVIVEAERAQNTVLDRNAILDIYNQTMASIGKSIGAISKNI